MMGNERRRPVMQFSSHAVGVGGNRFVAVSLVLFLLGVGCKQQETPKQAPAALEPVTVSGLERYTTR